MEKWIKIIVSFIIALLMMNLVEPFVALIGWVLGFAFCFWVGFTFVCPWLAELLKKLKQ